jgi:AmiR/NasT family two-component response regulator
MKQMRLIQNFRGLRALICAPENSSVGTLLETLPKLALVPEVVPVQSGQLVVLPRPCEGDIVILDGDLVLPVSWPNNDAPCPVIGLVGSEAPSRLRALVQLEALSFLSKPVHGGAIYAALFLAVNQFSRIAQMQAKLNELNERRRKRIHVLHAVVRIMRREGLDEDAAYASLRRAAMCARTSVEDLCQSLEEAETLTNNKMRQS